MKLTREKKIYFITRRDYRMDMIKEYESDSLTTEDNVDTFVPESNELDARSVRKVYLITYSQVDKELFPTRRSFVDAVVQSFNDSNVVQWCCSLEQHISTGIHYHMAIKLDRNKRWISSKRFLLESYGISVHFSEIHHNYYSAWKYVTKEDKRYIESKDHPDLTNTGPPRTTMASIAVQSRSRKKACHDSGQNTSDESDVGHNHAQVIRDSDADNNKAKRRKKRITSYELSEIALAKNIKSRTQLLALARQQKLEGKTDIAEFIVNRGAKVVSEVLDTAWEMENSTNDLERARKSRVQLLHEASQGECTEGCCGQWLACAKDVLERNGINAQYFARCVLELLEKGRGKYRNIMIVGAANCGKTFLLNPLNEIFNTFSNPASTSFAWVGAEKAECIFLNDFRWSPSVIQWHDFLLLLEGQLVHLPAPKTHYAKDIAFNKDTPIFATGKNPIVFVKNGTIDEKETEMMMVRWKIFRFHYQISQENQREMSPCAKCFAMLVLGVQDSHEDESTTGNHE